MISEKAVREFMDVWFAEYGRKISFNEAEILAENFLRLTKLVLKMNIPLIIRKDLTN